MNRFAGLSAVAVAIAFLVGCQGAKLTPGQAAKPAPQPTSIMLGDFEGQPAGPVAAEKTVDGWEAGHNATIEVSQEHATSGKNSIKANLGAGGYPGISIDYKKPQDWSNCQALRFSVFNAGKDMVVLSVRVDDALSGKNVATRYNGDSYPYKLGPGAHEVEVTMSALKEGSFLARGLDTSKIRGVRLFAQPKAPATLYFDNIRLYCAPPQAAGEKSIASFVGAGSFANSPKFEANEGATAKLVPGQPGPGAALEVTVTGGKYPGVSITPTEKDWLSYQLLCMDINVPAGGPSTMSAKIGDTSGRNQTVTLPVVPGANKITMPLEVVAEISQGKVATVQLIAAPPRGGEQKFLVNAMTLSRVDAVDFTTVRDDQAADALLRIDLKQFAEPRNTCFMGMVFIPLQSGKTRIVRCNAGGTGPTAYAIPAAAFEGAAKGKPVNVYIFVSDHGVWSYWAKSYNFEGTRHVEEFVHAK